MYQYIKYIYIYKYIINTSNDSIISQKKLKIPQLSETPADLGELPREIGELREPLGWCGG